MSDVMKRAAEALGDDEPVEAAIGALYQAFYKLRQAGKHQEEYDAMGTLLSMLTTDRAHMRKTFKVNP